MGSGVNSIYSVSLANKLTNVYFEDVQLLSNLETSLQCELHLSGE